jgi:SNF2 family DNA or RNA helicase
VLRILQSYQCDPDCKIVIFSSFNRTLTALRLALPPHRTAVFCGKLSPTARAAQLQRFRMDAQTNILIAHTTAAHGLNLGLIHVILIVEPLYHTTHLHQLMARITRFDQPRLQNQHIIQLVTSNTVEHRLQTMHDPVPDDIKVLLQSLSD